MRVYYEQLNSVTLENLEELDKLLESYNFPKLNEEKADSLNRPITSKGMNSNRDSPKIKIPSQHGFMGFIKLQGTYTPNGS